MGLQGRFFAVPPQRTAPTPVRYGEVGCISWDKKSVSFIRTVPTHLQWRSTCISFFVTPVQVKLDDLSPRLYKNITDDNLCEKGNLEDFQ